MAVHDLHAALVLRRLLVFERAGLQRLRLLGAVVRRAVDRAEHFAVKQARLHRIAWLGRPRSELRVARARVIDNLTVSEI